MVALRISVALCVWLSITGCRRPAPHPGPPEGVTTLSNAEVEVDDVSAASLDFARRLRGAWVVRDDDDSGSARAWDVGGDTVTIYDPARRRSVKERFALVSPCRLVHVRPIGSDPYLDGGGSEQIATTDTFVFASDGLHVAAAPAAGGFRRGSVVIACIGDHLYRSEPRSALCGTWAMPVAGPAMSSGFECGIDQGVLVDELVVRPFGGGESMRLPFYGDALLSPALVAHVAEAQPSFEEATRRADALLHGDARVRIHMGSGRD